MSPVLCSISEEIPSPSPAESKREGGWSIYVRAHVWRRTHLSALRCDMVGRMTRPKREGRSTPFNKGNKGTKMDQPCQELADRQSLRVTLARFRPEKPSYCYPYLASALKTHQANLRHSYVQCGISLFFLALSSADIRRSRRRTHILCLPSAPTKETRDIGIS